MSGPDFTAWMQRHGFTIRGAAVALGCSTLTIQRYRKPDAKIPRYFALACSQLDYELSPVAEIWKVTYEAP